MTNTTNSTYTVNMIIGSDTCSSVTTVVTDTPETAALTAQMMFTDTVVRIVSVLDSDGNCDTALCEDDDHWCCNCDVTHLETDGSCFNCSYDI